MRYATRLSLVALFIFAIHGAAQSRPTASRAYGASAFAGVSYVRTDYPSTDPGFTLGLDFTRYLRRVSPSLEVRFTDGFGDPVGERTFSGGLKLEKPLGRLHVYLDGLIGAGTVTYAHPAVSNGVVYASDNSLVYSGGGGIDVEVRGPFALKVDYQVQTWRLGSESARFYPSAATVGAVYRISSRSFRSDR